MRCSHCHQDDTKVIESRDVSEGQAIRRRRACLHCQHRFTTYERIERPQLVVIKNDQTRELFDRQKLLRGLYRACEKTPVSALQLELLIADVEAQLYNIGETEVPSRKVGKMVMERLAELSEVAYVRFASVYRGFKDIKGFEKELSQIREIKAGLAKKPKVKVAT